MRHHKITTSLSILLIILLSGCGASTAKVPTPLPTATSYPFVTATPLPFPTATVPTATPTPTATIFIPTHTPTVAITRTPTSTGEPTATPGRGPTATIPGVCDHEPEGVFKLVFDSESGVKNSLGCPTRNPDEKDSIPQAWAVSTIYQPLERGILIWLSNVGWLEGRIIYVMLDDQNYTRKDDFFDPFFDAESGNHKPPEGLFEPINALGKVWRETPGLRDTIGFGLEPETAAESQMQMFQFGEMVYIPSIDTVFVFRRGTSNTWTAHPLSEPEENDEHDN